jgi:hypothetical protein
MEEKHNVRFPDSIATGLPKNVVAKSMELSNSRKAAKRCEFSNIVGNQNVHYIFQKISPMIPIFGEINPVLTTAFNFSNAHSFHVKVFLVTLPFKLPQLAPI